MDMRAGFTQAMSRVLASVALFALAGATMADIEYFVDADGGSDAWDGLSATHVDGTSVGPKKTIGAAVELANNDGVDSIVTLAPGRYDKGEYFEDGMTNRVVITKPHLKIRSSGSKNDTFIVGNHDPSNANGIGPAAVRGIYIVSNLVTGVGADYQATNVVIEGVTICNGATVSGGRGGGVYCRTPDAGGASILIDCVVSNCSADDYGGALYRQNAYRTLFTGNYAKNGGSAMAFGAMVCCVIARNRGPATTYNMRTAVNCTFACNEQYVIFGGYTMECYNCLSFGNGTNNGAHPNGNVYVNLHDCVSAAPTRIPGTVTDSITNATSVQCVSTAFFDWRILSDSPAIGKGQGKWFTGKVVLPPGYTLQDYLGNPIDTSGTLDCGAVQSTAFTPDSGRIVFTSPFRMDGYDAVSANKTYHYPTNSMAASRIRSTPASGVPYMVYWDAPGGSQINMVPQYDGWTRILPPTGADSAITVSTYTATHVLYVDKENGNNSYDGLSATVKSPTSGPLKTLQAAAEAVKDFEYSIVYVAPGVYDEGFRTHTEEGLVCTNRLKPYSSVGFIAAQGPGTATIKGAPDPDTGGLGPGAIRCFFPMGRSYLQGFILSDGYTQNSDRWAGRGGAAYFGNSTYTAACLADCVVTNCHSHLGVVFYGISWRTKFFDNHVYSGELFRFDNFFSCIFAGNTTADGSAMFRSQCTLWGCTIDKLDDDMNLHYESSPGSEICGNLLATRLSSPVPAARGNCLAAEPFFVDRAARDFRLGSMSPAIGAFRRSDFYATGANFRVPADIDGNDYIWKDGATSAGALQNRPIAMYIVTGDGGGVSVSGGSAGTNIVEEATTITVVATDVANRPFLGLEVDGAMLPASQTSYSFQVSPDMDHLPSVCARYGTTWYVDCLGGSDSNSGGTLATAKATIRAATTNAVAGDLVLVAPGTYGVDEGSQLHPSHINKDDTNTPVTVGARVLVPRNVVVRSIEGPESTVILGGTATSGANEWGCGEGAVRCVTLLGVGSRLEGFTLTGGRTAIGSGAHDDYAAAGVLSGNGGVASGCIISNNAASRCGAVFRTVLLDSRVFDNKVSVRASIGRESTFHRCIFDNNKGPEQAIQYFSYINSCTFGPGNTDLNDKPQHVIAYANGGTSTIINSIVMGSVLAQNNYPFAAINCAFMTNRAPSTASITLTDCVITNAEMLALDEHYRPVIGSNAAIDTGNSTLIASQINDGLDISGLQRVMNGEMDIGAMEADWRPVYARYIGGKSLSVTNVSPEVYANASKEVCLPSGEIGGVVSGSSLRSHKFTVVFRVTGTGTFNIYLDGTLAGSYVFSEDTQNATFMRSTDSFGMRLEYVPGAGDTGMAIVSEARLAAGTCIHLR